MQSQREALPARTRIAVMLVFPLTHRLEPASQCERVAVVAPG
jgi:hypothetical protein